MSEKFLSYEEMRERGYDTRFLTLCHKYLTPDGGIRLDP